MLTAEQIQSNWEKFLSLIDTHISSPRKEKLLEFYNRFEDRFVLMPASHKVAYHNCFPGGYVDHVNRVVEASLKLYDVWEQMGTDMTTFTKEELVFSAINHDLGKFGTETEASYLEQTDEWRRTKLNETYMFNNTLEFMSVPDRSLYLLQTNGIEYSKNEFLAIKLHDGIYEEANKPYLLGYLPEQKPRTSLIFIVHQADLLAARVEFETEWLPKFKTPKTEAPVSAPVKVRKTKEQLKNDVLGKALGKSNDVLKTFFK